MSKRRCCVVSPSICLLGKRKKPQARATPEAPLPRKSAAAAYQRNPRSASSHTPCGGPDGPPCAPAAAATTLVASDGRCRSSGWRRRLRALGERWGFFVGPGDTKVGDSQKTATRGEDDGEVQARVHLARRLRARPEPAGQDEDRRV